MAKSDKCSLCKRPNFRDCPCPWHKPFEKWPGPLKQILYHVVVEETPEAQSG
jgi:hypothetical protein